MLKKIVALRRVSKFFDDVPAVNKLTFEVYQGQFLAILGPSGCGKTTTLRLLAGFETPDEGEIDINGRVVSSPTVFVPPEKRKIGMVFQSYALFPHLNVAKNVAYGLPRGFGRNKQVEAALKMVQLEHLGQRMPHELSGGQQQRIALARALAPEPALILLDEPFSNLDAGLRHKVRQEMRQILRQADMTAVFVTHDQEEALSLCDKIAVMLDGSIEQVDNPYDVYEQPANKAVAKFIGEANFLAGHADGYKVSCELGDSVSYRHYTGPVEVMLRPEALTPTLDEAGSVKIIDREYFGRDQILICVLPSGVQVRVRLLGADMAFAPGKRLRLNLPPKVMAFKP